MKVFYHKTDGGAEYLSLNPETEKFWDGCFARTDGDEIEIYSEVLKRRGITLNIC